MVRIKEISDMINNYCENYQYYWACGLIRETSKLWTGDNLNLLCDTAKTMANHYNEKGI